MDFKWTLSRPGIELEFETGSIKEAIGILEQEGSQISEVFGFTMNNHHTTDATPNVTEGEGGKPPRKPRSSNKSTVDAVAPDPLPVPSAPVVDMTPTANGIPAGLVRDPATNTAPALIGALSIAPPLPVPGAHAIAPPPVGVLGPKVVAALEKYRVGKADGGQGLADWLADSGLTIKGKTYDEACRAVLMISDDKLKAVAEHLGA